MTAGNVTRLGWHPREQAAIAYGRRVAARMQRPLRLPGEAAP